MPVQNAFEPEIINKDGSKKLPGAIFRERSESEGQGTGKCPAKNCREHNSWAQRTRRVGHREVPHNPSFSISLAQTPPALSLLTCRQKQ